MKIYDAENREKFIGQFKEGKVFSVDSSDCQLMEADNDEKTTTWKIVPTEITIDGRAIFVPGVDTTDYDKRKLPFFWNHWEDYQIGQGLYTKKKPNDESPTYIIMKTRYMKTEFAQEVYENVVAGFYNMVSPGLWPVESYFYEDAVREYEQDYGRKPKRSLSYYGRKTILYETSIAPIAAWSGAQKMAALNKSGMSEKMKNRLTFDIFHDYIETISDLQEKVKVLYELTDTLGIKPKHTGDVSQKAETLGVKEVLNSGDVTREEKGKAMQAILAKHLQKDIPNGKESKTA